MSGTAGRIEAQGCFGCFGGAVRLFLGGRRLDLRRSCGWLRLGEGWSGLRNPARLLLLEGRPYPWGHARLLVLAGPAARGFPRGPAMVWMMLGQQMEKLGSVAVLCARLSRAR